MKAETTAYGAHEIEQHLIRSKIVPQAFTIRIQQPISRTDRTERFPVLYATDGDEFFNALSSFASLLQSHGEAPRFILVGIGYDRPRVAGTLRMRDLLTHDIREHFAREITQVANSGLSDANDLDVVVRSTDAKEFLHFIREELIPFVDARYPVLQGDNSYWGYSAGGSFGLHTLFSKPETFRRYILGSPATSYRGHNFGIELAEGFVRSGRLMDAKVFMSVGELEEFKKGMTQYDLVTGYYRLAKSLKALAIPGLDLTLQMFPGETHATAWMHAFTHGVKALFGPAGDVPYWPDFMKQELAAE